MVKVIGLLRGVNVGSSRRLRMADLRAAVESLGHTDVETYLQSGNVVFVPAAGTGKELGPSISDALEARVGLRANVLTRTGAEMASIVDANPYQRDDPTKVVVTFHAGRAGTPPLNVTTYAPEGLTTRAREVYLDLPFGQARSPLLAALAKAQPDDGFATSRNWRTVLALRDLSAG